MSTTEAIAREVTRLGEAERIRLLDYARSISSTGLRETNDPLSDDQLARLNPPDADRSRSPDDQRLQGRILIDSAIHHGAPCIRGTRVAVSVIVASLADYSVDELLEQYPQLSKDDVAAVLLFASDAAHVRS